MAFLTISKSGTLALNERSKQLEISGRPIHRLGFGESPFLPPPYVQSALQNAAIRKDYTPVAGLPELRERIADFHQEIDGYPVSMEQVLVAPGTKPLLSNIMHAFRDAEVYLPAPSWVSYAPQAAMAGHRLIRLPTSWDARWRVDPELLDDTITREGCSGSDKLIVLNYPGNPHGLTYSRDELQALATVLRKHEAWAVADEIYALLHHRGLHVSLASIYPERTLVTTGMSKWCGAGGWRLGALFLPQDTPADLYDAMVGLGSETYSCASVPIQVAALTAYELSAELHDFLNRQRHVLAVIGHMIHAEVTRLGIRAHRPEGGFYMLIDFSPFAEILAQREIHGDADLCERLLEEAGVALLPGSIFGMTATDLTARLAYVDFDGLAALEDALEDDSVILRHAGKMLRGISDLSQWLNRLSEDKDSKQSAAPSLSIQRSAD